MQKLVRGCVIVAVLSAACAPPLARPPAVFPMKEEWRYPLTEAIQAPLVTDGKRLFVVTRSGEITALDLGGNPLWKADVGPGTLGADPDGVVVRSPDGTLMGLDPESGTLRWKLSTGIEGSLPPLVTAGSVYVGGKGVASVDAATGSLLWIKTDGEVIAPLTATADYLFDSESGGVLRCRNRTSGESAWTFAPGADTRAAVAVSSDGTTFAGVGRALVAVRADGTKRRWRWRLGAEALMPPEVREESVLMAAHDATLYALNKENGHLNWRAPLPSRPQSGPLVFGVVVLVACLDNVVSGFDARNGRSLGELRTPAPILDSPLMVGSRLYAALRSDPAPLLEGNSSIGAYSLILSPAAPAGTRPATPSKGKDSPQNRNP